MKQIKLKNKIILIESCYGCYIKPQYETENDGSCITTCSLFGCEIKDGDKICEECLLEDAEMKKYRYYFSERVNFYVEIDAESLKDAQKKLDDEDENIWDKLEIIKVESNKDCLSARYPCEESYYNADQWEEIK